MRLLIDTNVFLDFFLQREGSEEAKKLFTNCYKNQHEIYISSMSLRDIGYVSHRFFHSEEKARDVQLKTYSLVSKVCGISADASIDALFSGNADYEDVLQINAAKEILADAIVTNDKKGFKKWSDICIFTPKELNDHFPKRVIL